MVFQWVVLPFLQLFWHVCCHSQDRTLGKWRKCCDFFWFIFFSIELIIQWPWKNDQKLLEVWHASKEPFPSFSYRRCAWSMHSLTLTPGVARREGQEGKAREAKLMKWWSRKLLSIPTNNVHNENFRTYPVRVWKLSFLHHVFMQNLRQSWLETRESCPLSSEGFITGPN